MTGWVHSHAGLVWWLAAVSVAMFVLSLLLVPVLAVRIPADYFKDPTKPQDPVALHHPAARVPIKVARNLAGLVLVILGIAMLVLPGQGLLTVVLGLLVADFPGKYRLERWIVLRPAVLKAINWQRRRKGREPLRVAGYTRP
jgi:hypothetical protein